MIHVGFTGTRRGMTDAQLDAVGILLADLVSVGTHAHHGDCIGADAQFHDLAHDIGAIVVVHPPRLFSGRINWIASCVGDERREPLSHMQRNAAIVAESTLLIAAPAEATEQPRGGTWSTVRMARRKGRPIAIVLPDGTVTRERWPTRWEP